MYTEEQAKEKFCPYMAQVGAIMAVAAAISNTSVEVGVTCSASKCMMWRWSEEEINTGKTIRDQYEGIKPVYADGGYCGMAGKP